MARKGSSRPGFFGTTHHYDSSGKKTGTSRPGMFGTVNHYDNSGRKTGHSNPGFFGSYNHYDSSGRKTGSSTPGFFGSYNHKNSRGKSTGHSDPSAFGGYNHHDTQGCYVATCVYGSYDCPQVWTLRRFRDNMLSRTLTGRTFIHVYYSVSPTIVKWFGGSLWFKYIWQGILDAMVTRLNQNGVEDSPYQDREW